MKEVSGFLNLNKPPGPSSFTMVRLVRRLTGIRRVGHGGTLDPSATGVLPVCVGQATRMSDYLLSAGKRYTVGVRLGVATDTFDAEGHVVEERDPSGISRAQVEQALNAFRGRLRQVPPMYSALKHQGRPLYKLAREGVEVERRPREVEVYRLELTAWGPPSLALEVECSRGTYMRSLAHDLGAALGCGAHMSSLVRAKVGPFTLAEAVSVGQLFDAVQGGHWEALLYPLDCVIPQAAAAILDEESLRAVRYGRPLPNDSSSARAPRPGEPCRAYDLEGDLVALLAYDAARQAWQPSKVFLGAPPS